MDDTYSAAAPPRVQHVFDKYCEPRPVNGLPHPHEIVLMTTKTDRWLMRKDTISGPHDADMSMWSTPFQGGIDIASHVLKNAADYAGKTVLDIGSGSGLVAIAAAMAGARVIAIDSSRMACWAIATNAALNDVTLQVGEGNVASSGCWIEINEDHIPYGELAGMADVITAGDVFYNGRVSEDIALTLLEVIRAGKTVLASSGEENMHGYFIGAGVQMLDRHYNGEPRFVRLTGDVRSPAAKPPAPFRSGSYTDNLVRRLRRNNKPDRR